MAVGVGAVGEAELDGVVLACCVGVGPKQEYPLAVVRLLSEARALEVTVIGSQAVGVSPAVRGPRGDVDVDVPRPALWELHVPGEGGAGVRAARVHAVLVACEPEPGGCSGEPVVLYARPTCAQVPGG